MPELKPCPFCGQEPHDRLARYDDELAMAIECSHCGIIVKKKLENPNPVYYMSFKCISRAYNEAVDLWNTRSE